jgi:hypothetical protein
MAKGRAGRGPTRMDKRREAEAAEAKEAREKEDGEEEEETEEEAEAEPDAESDSDGDDEEGGKKKKKPAKKKAVKKAAAPKKPATKRSRAAKEVRRKAVWIVYDNASKKIDTFPFNQKAEAEALLAKKIEEKKGTFYLNLVKEPIEE